MPFNGIFRAQNGKTWSFVSLVKDSYFLTICCYLIEGAVAIFDHSKIIGQKYEQKRKYKLS